MPHLTLEALARLVEEAPTTEEREHLTGCAFCRDELDAIEQQTEALGSLPKMSPPPELWPDLRTRLRKEGLVDRGRRPARTSPTLSRIAAALALFVAGGATGYAVRGPMATETAGPPEQAVAAAPGSDASSAEAPGSRPEPAGPARQLPVTGSGDVAADVERAQEAFAAALDRYMMATGTEAPDPAARLAALDQIVMTTAEALNESPADPVINSYHLTAVAQRNDLLRQIAASGDPVF